MRTVRCSSRLLGGGGCLPRGVCTGGVCLGGGVSYRYPLWTESQTPVKTLPCRTENLASFFHPELSDEGNLFSHVWQSVLFCSRGGFPCDHYQWCIGSHSIATPSPTTWSNLLIIKHVWLASNWNDFLWCANSLCKSRIPWKGWLAIVPRHRDTDSWVLCKKIVKLYTIYFIL